MTENKYTRKRLRSPSYPYINLETAIEKTRIFYEAEKLNRAPATVALSHLGYTGGSSSGYRTLASMTSFGLLSEEGTRQNRDVWLSDLGKDIILDYEENSIDRLRAIQKAALMPPIHEELWNKYHESGSGLPSNATLKTYLIKDMQFNPKAVDSFIEEFRETLRFSKLSIGDTDKRLVDKHNDRSDDGVLVRDQPSISSKAKPPANQVLSAQMQENTIPLIGGGMAILITPVPLSKRNYEHIKKWLTLMEEAFVFELDQRETEE